MKISKLTKNKNKENIVKKVVSVVNREKNKNIYLIIDGDKTLSRFDGTIKFCECAGINFDVILNFFENYDYTFKNFYQVARFYSTIDENRYEKAAAYSASKVLLYRELAMLLRKYNKRVVIFLVTAGVKLMWEKILIKNNLDFVHLFGGNYLKYDKYIIDKESKGLIVKLLKRSKKKVIVFGDSLVDEDMLKRADHGFLVVNENMNSCIASNDCLKSDKISQISFNGMYHANINKKVVSDIELLINKYIKQTQ